MIRVLSASFLPHRRVPVKVGWFNGSSKGNLGLGNTRMIMIMVVAVIEMLLNYFQ